MKKLSLVEPNKDYGITALDGVPVVSSRNVAAIFGKEHKGERFVRFGSAILRRQFQGKLL